MVETALATLQLLVSKPSALFDPYAALAALEQLVDSAREVGDERARGTLLPFVSFVHWYTIQRCRAC